MDCGLVLVFHMGGSPQPYQLSFSFHDVLVVLGRLEAPFGLQAGLAERLSAPEEKPDAVLQLFNEITAETQGIM